MQLSAFNVYVDSFPEPGETLVYNTWSGGSAVLDDATLASLRALAQEHGSASLGLLVEAGQVDPALCEPDLGLVVESRASEERGFHQWLRATKEDTRSLSAQITTSHACNLACTYCYEEEVMSGRVMSPATADASARFLAERVVENRPERVDLTFIGGEPLLHPRTIERVAAALKPVCDEHGARFGFQIITNGTLLTPELVERLVPLGLDQIQVTLDGDEDSHGRTRIDKKGRNTFMASWQNLLAVAPLVPVCIQGNYTEENLHGFVPLLERARRDGLDPRRVPRIKFKPALAALGTPEDAGIDSCTWSASRPEVAVALGDAVRAFGYRTHDQLGLGPCGIHQLHHYSIGPDGLIYKCPGFVGKPEWATGNVETGLTPRHRQLNTLANTRECGSCSFRPTCAGGCIAIEWVATKRPEGINCERGYFDAAAADLLKRNYFLDTLEPDEALAAIAELPRAELPTVPQMRPRAIVAREPLVQIRPSPRRAAIHTEMRP